MPLAIPEKDERFRVRNISFLENFAYAPNEDHLGFLVASRGLEVKVDQYPL